MAEGKAKDDEAVKLLLLAWRCQNDIARQFEAAGAKPVDMLLVAAMVIYTLRGSGTPEELGKRAAEGARLFDRIETEAIELAKSRGPKS